MLIMFLVEIIHLSKSCCTKNVFRFNRPSRNAMRASGGVYSLLDSMGRSCLVIERDEVEAFHHYINDMRKEGLRRYETNFRSSLFAPALQKALSRLSR